MSVQEYTRSEFKKVMRSDTGKRGKWRGKTAVVPTAQAEKEDEKRRLHDLHQHPKSVQDAIFYTNMLENGICEIEPGIYSASMRISDINYQSLPRQERTNIFLSYCELLNSIEADTLQVTIVKKQIDDVDFQRNILYPVDPAENDDLDEYREIVNGVLKQKALMATNHLNVEKYLTFTVDANSPQAAAAQLATMEAQAAQQLRRINSQAVTQNGQQRLSLLYDLLQPNNEDPFAFEYEQLLGNSLHTKDSIAPDSLVFSDDTFRLGNSFSQVLYVSEMQSSTNDRFLKNLCDLPFQVAISVFYKGVDQGAAREFVKTKLMFMQGEADKVRDRVSARSQRNVVLTEQELVRYIPRELQSQIRGAEKFLKDLDENSQRMFMVTFVIMVTADSQEELETNIYAVRQEANKNGLRLRPLALQQKEGLNSVLPLGKNFTRIERTMTTASAAIFIPFACQEVMDHAGVFWGTNVQSGNLVLYNRYLRNAPSIIVLGQPGGGKSFLIKLSCFLLELLRHPTDEFMIIDLDGEYTDLIHAVGGQVITLSENDQERMNPFDLSAYYGDINSDESPLAFKSAFLHTLLESLIGGLQGFDQAEFAMIDRVIRMTYLPLLRTAAWDKMKSEQTPTFLDFLKNLRLQPEEVAQRLALELEPYVDGSFSIFSGQTTVNLGNRVVCFNLRRLPQQMKTSGLLVALDQVWNRLSYNWGRGIRTHFILEEVQSLLRDTSAISRYFEDLWTRSRKRGMVLTAATQNVALLLQSAVGQNILLNSDTQILLKQSAVDAAWLAEHLGISDEQISYILNASAGDGILKFDESVVQFSGSFPRGNKIYDLITTNPNDGYRSKK